MEDIMPNKTFKLDGKEASKIVRSYFDEVHGPFAVVGFQILKTELNKKANRWIIECDFFPGFVSRKAQYLVEIDAKTGSIESVHLEKETPTYTVKLPGKG